MLISQAAKGIRHQVIVLIKMAVNQFCPAWRTKRCKYFDENGACNKGWQCRFAHIDKEGNDAHQYYDPIQQTYVMGPRERKPKRRSEDSPDFYIGEVGDMEECGEDDNTDEVGAMAMSREEEEIGLGIRLQPHFGTYRGIGAKYVGSKLINVLKYDTAKIKK